MALCYHAGMKNNFRKKITLGLVLFIVGAFALAGCSGGSNANSTDNTPGTDSSGSGSSTDTGSGTDTSGGQDSGASTLTDTSDAVLSQIIDDANLALGDANALPAAFTDPITVDTAPGMLGLVPDDFTPNVTDATGATGMLNSQAFQVAVVKCTDANSAVTVSGKIQDGFDSSKWVCVFPEQSLTMVSGQYVLLAVGTTVQTDALAEAFKVAAGGAQGPYIFYTGVNDSAGSPAGGGGGMALDVGGGGGLALDVADNGGDSGSVG